MPNSLQPASKSDWTGAVLALIADERRRQIQDKGYDACHDAGHDCGELAAAAANYALNAACQLSPYDGLSNDEPPDSDSWPSLSGEPWPWKPKDAKRDLVRAGALIAAELERMLRRDFVSHGKQEPAHG